MHMTRITVTRAGALEEPNLCAPACELLSGDSDSAGTRNPQTRV